MPKNERKMGKDSNGRNQKLQVSEQVDPSEVLKEITENSELGGKPIGVQKEQPKYTCTIRELAKFPDATERQKWNIVNGFVNAPTRRSFWHQMSEKAIRKSLIGNGDHRPLYEELGRLKALGPYTGEDEKNKEANRKLCITDIDRYLKLEFPLKFRKHPRTEIKPAKGDIRYLDYLGIRIRISPDYIFRTQVEGQAVVGAVRLRMTKGKKFKLSQHRIISYLLYKYLEKHVAGPDENVDPDLCYCIDVYAEKVVPAPTGTDVPSKILIEICKEFAAIWDKTEVIK